MKLNALYAVLGTALFSSETQPQLKFTEMMSNAAAPTDYLEITNLGASTGDNPLGGRGCTEPYSRQTTTLSRTKPPAPALSS